MKIQKIRLIIVLIFLSLISLIGVQIFWASHAYQSGKKTFELNVLKAMQQTVDDYNKKITCFELFSKVRIFPRQGLYMLRQPWDKEKERFVPADSILPDTIPMYFSGANDRMPFDYGHLSFSWPVDLEMILRFEYLDVDSPESVPRKGIKPNDISVQNFRERFSSDKSITERYEPFYIDSILNQQLKNFSITDSFHFGYIRNDTLAIEYVYPGGKENKLLKSALRIPLGNDKYFSKPLDLVVYFENIDGLVFAGLKSVLFLSVIIVLILLASFYFSIHAILRQRKLSELKNDFINNMTHEFKTPLANISIALETIDVGPEDPTRRSRILQIIGQETERLQENVEKILQVARFEQGSILLQCEELHLNQLIVKAVSYFESNMQNNNPDIQYHLNAKPDIINADETHLINVICNLVDNAIKYSEGKAEISIRTENKNKGLSISIADKGIGMKEETQKRIFEKFYRATTGNIHSVQGFGLGLAYVKSIIDSHSGLIEVQSQLGKGSVFTIYLPYHP